MDVYYNGVTLKHAMVTSWDETAEYDSSGMNLVGNKITLTVEGVVFPLSFLRHGSAEIWNGLSVDQDVYKKISPDAPNANISGFSNLENPDVAVTREPTETFAFRLNACLRQLTMPRGYFEMKNSITGEVLFRAYAQDSKNERLVGAMRRNCDVDGGPKPQSVRVAQTTNEFAKIVFSITIVKIRCLAGEVQESGEELGSDPLTGFVVSNRCWTEESIDANFYVTRTFTGKLRISSVEKSVHFYRDMYYPPLEDGFKRESVRFSESENGLELSYVVTDKQTRISPPYPATAFSGTCTYKIENSCMLTLNISLTMIGRPDADKKMLVARAFEAVTKKADSFTNNGTSGFQTNLSVAENFGDPPSVTVTCAYTLFSPESESITDDVNALATLVQPKMALMGTPLEWEDKEYNDVVYVYERFKSPKPNPYGYNVFSAYDDNTSKKEEQTAESGTESGDTESGEEEDAQKSATYGFIKCMATVPCLMRKPLYSQGESGDDEEDDMSAPPSEVTPYYVHSPANKAEIKDELATKVYRDANNVEYSVRPSGAKQKTISYPYSFYKSDISYYTDYSRVVLPKATQVATKKTETNASDENSGNNTNTNGETSEESKPDYTTYSVSKLQSTLKAKEKQLELEQTGRDADAAAELYDQVEIHDAAIKALKKEIAEIKAELESRTTVRVVQVAKPVPKARVIIEAERYGRLPEMPDPDEIVTTTGDDPIVFTPVKVKTRLCEPKAARNTPNSVSYSIIGTYEYAMSRPYKKGDEVWLLMNPTFGSACYYPKVPNDAGDMIDDVSALKCLYYGDQMTHVEDDDEQQESTETPENQEQQPSQEQQGQGTNENGDNSGGTSG